MSDFRLTAQRRAVLEALAAQPDGYLTVERVAAVCPTIWEVSRSMRDAGVLVPHTRKFRQIVAFNITPKGRKVLAERVREVQP